MKDTEILAQIRSGDHDQPIKELYKEFPKVKALLLASGGTQADAEETFHDAIILLIEKVSEPSFELSSQLTTFFYGINRLLWKNKLRKLNKTHELEWSDTLIITEEDIDYNEEKEAQIKVLEGILTKITKRCLDIFTRFYFKKETMKTIKDALGYTSINSAKTQKYKCMEQAIKLAQTSLS